LILPAPSGFPHPDGQPLPTAAERRTLFFEPEGPGFVRLTVMDARGATDSVVVRLQ
jgi:penicillin-binding protein 1C